MASPLVQWFDVTNTAQKTEWQIGVVDAGSPSPASTFLIWNNRGVNSDVSDMTNCTITTKDVLGSNTGEVVINKWIEARVDSMNETQFTAIGGTTTKVVQAGGAAGAGKIKGTANDGSLGAVANYAKVTLQAMVPATATAGSFTFLTRIAYQFT
ncbi:hypothetical protein GRF59_05530 [Paenibacillus sp. HJL G12]|uniref:Uncharacterized protein n=1 Tax=Paenibacillus dendrobii TaxID=2691084 RepID=A0A7X3LGD5_9BACL|nr:hypothetical protein [Paenibacillus dendrobii]MWV43085.1 hypothetical protein [Paenibacillus dendrobii]